MGKGAGVSDWHRKQRKKELAKNKMARIAARDERVKETKSIAEVQEEIKTLERHHKNAETRPHAVQSKLDRLKKELKLVKEQAEEAKKSAPAAKKMLAPVSTYKPLENPAVSVYYDPVMNPFGAPPPGKPRLYHRLGGGVTVHLEEAGIPGEAPPPPPPPSNTQQWRQQPIERPCTGTKTSGIRSAPPPLPKEPPPPPTQAPEARKAPVEPPKKVIDPTRLPSLPQPSAAVKRSRRNVTADIWASQEEVDYEEAVGSSLEGVAVPLQWWYQDQTGQIQGPYAASQLQEWIQAGYFPATTLVRSSPAAPWKQLGQVKPFSTQMQQPKSRAGPAVDSVHDRIAALKLEREKEESSSVQDRIAALKGEHSSTDDSVQARIAALRGEFIQHAGEPAFDEDSNSGDVSQSIQDRIATMREDRLKGDSEQLEHDDELVQTHSCAGRQGREQDDEGIPDSTQALMADKNHSHLYEQEIDLDEATGDITESGAPPFPPGPSSEDLPLPPSGDSAMDIPLPSQPVQVGLPLPPPPPPPGPSSMDVPLPPPPSAVSRDDLMPAYPMNEHEGIAPYPVDSSNIPAYLIDVSEGPAGMSYPVESYPADADGEPVTDEYPVVDPYPVDSESVAGEPSSKLTKTPLVVDREVVSMLPSHLQKRKLAKHTVPVFSPEKKRKIVAEGATPKNHDRDYERFMSEMDQL